MIYTCRQFPSDLLEQYPILKRPQGKRVGKNKRRYLSAVCAFDIETTRISEDYSFMYIWQLQIGLNTTIIGRNWHEFDIAIKRLIAGLPEDVYLVFWVHNLSFEFAFLRGIYKFSEDEIFAVESRRPLRLDMHQHIEFRCSYLHTNMRLEMFLKKMGVPHLKTTLDYSKKRYPWTPLSEEELEYCVNDVRGLVEALMIEMSHDGDDLYTIPATSTGYVRRDVKRALQKICYTKIKPILPDIETYHLLREAFRGGDCHGNRFYTGQVIDGVLSRDRVSSYPDVQMNGLFPIGPFRKAEEPSLELMEKLIHIRQRAVLARLEFFGIRLRHPYAEGCPYISSDKCRKLGELHKDNGRILSASHIEITVTEIDYEIIAEQYEWDRIIVRNLEYSRKGPLPEELKGVIREYFRLKTELPKSDPLREKSKNKLNAIYGMSSQNPVKRNIIYKPDPWYDPDLKRVRPPGFYEDDSVSDEELLEKANKRAFFPYQWGVWTTALARKELFLGRKNVTDQGGIFLYCDTDSVKYLEPEGVHVEWDSYNAERMRLSMESGASAVDPKGERQYMGIFGPDDGYPACFAMRGAKKYAVEHDGEIEVTVSGVNKKLGGPELEKLGGLKVFAKSGEVIFRDAGGVKLKYNDQGYFMTKAEGRRIKIRPCVTISEKEYTMSDTDEYSDLMLTLSELRSYMWDVYGIR